MGLRIAIMTVGTRGDVQPMLALASALRSRGHTVDVAAPSNFESWVQELGFRFHSLGLDMEKFLDSPEVKRAVSGDWLGLARVWRKTIVPVMDSLLKGVHAVGKDADVIIFHPKVYGASDLAEATGARLVCASLIPVFPTQEFPVPIWARNFGPFLNKLSYSMFSLSRLPYRTILNRWRRTILGLGKGALLAYPWQLRGQSCLRLCPVSPTVLPPPADWDTGVHMTGYWFLEQNRNDWKPDDSLKEFLKQGPPPIYIGFGSMTNRAPDQLTRMVLKAVSHAGVRAVLATGWGGLSPAEVPRTVHTLSSAPHEALFPLCRAVVHHGGAGTTAAGLRAGRPTLICPHFVDQPFWARRVYWLGCGPEPLPLKHLTADLLAARLKQLVNIKSYGDRASKIASDIALEDGLEYAMRLITEDL